MIRIALLLAPPRGLTFQAPSGTLLYCFYLPVHYIAAVNLSLCPSWTTNCSLVLLRSQRLPRWLCKLPVCYLVYCLRNNTQGADFDFTDASCHGPALISKKKYRLVLNAEHASSTDVRTQYVKGSSCVWNHPFGTHL